MGLVAQFGSWSPVPGRAGPLYRLYVRRGPGAVVRRRRDRFYALPYTVVLYPLVFLPVLRLWSVSRVHGYVTPADFVQGRYGSSLLATWSR